MLGQAIQQNVQSHGYPNSADLDFRGTDFGPAQMLRTSTVICSTSKLTNTRKNEKPRRHLKPFDERTIKSTKTVDGIAGIKVRKWQDDQTGKSLSNGFHRSGSINHSSISPVTDSDLVQNEDSGTAEMHSPTDVMMKRSHSWDLHTGSSPAECESISDNLEAIKSNDTETHPITSAAYMHETLTSPKRHHPASPSSLGPRSVILYAKEESATTSPIEDKMQGTNPSTTSVYCESSASMCREEVNREKPVIGCDMAVTKVLTDEPLPGYERVFPSPYQQSEDDAPGVSEKQKTNQLNGLNRSGSLLPRPGHGGTASLMSSRNKTVARSKRHSSRTNLYIRGLPKSMSENDLVSLVPDASAIRSVKLVVNNDGEGYGFIDFISNEAAVVAMQHIKLQNSSQYVNFAYESEKDPLNVYVTNIPESWNSDNVENLKQIFAPYGKITSALVMTRRSTNTCTGTGFVRYLTSEEAQRAIDGIRKAKITLPGAKRPLELKLADRQRTREHKSELTGLDGCALPLFHQFTREDTQHHLSQALKTQQQHHNQLVEDLFNAANVAERTLFDQTKVAGYVPSGPPMVSPSPADITPTSAEEMSASAPPQLPTPAVMPVSPAVAAAAATAAALATPLYQFACIPWIQQDPTVTHGNTTAAYIHPQIAATAAPKAAVPTNPLELNSLATIYQMAGLGVLNYGTPAPSQPFDMVLPLLNGQLSGQPVDATNVYPFGINQPLWPKACFYGYPNT